MSRSTFVAAGALLAAMAVATGTAIGAEPAPSGEAVYQHWCAPCHAPGPGHPGTQSLQVKYAGKTPAVLVERTDLSAQAIATFVRTGVLSMPPFRKTEVSDAELAALTGYITSVARKR
jgi:mono/diheme cytochrome c family protein